jgi:lysozyme
MFKAVWEAVRPYTAKAVVILTISGAGLAGIQHFEGTVPAVYVDPVGIATACTGHTKTVTLADVGKKIPMAVCQDLLRQDAKEHEAHVRKAVRVPMTQDQFDALTSLGFNIGGSALAASTLVRKLNAGDCWGAGAEFPRWNKARGRVLPGLVKRRAWERALFEKGCV